MSKNHASPRSRARMHARARARGHHAWLARSTSRPCMHGAYAAVRRGACMLLVLTLRVNQQQDQRGRHRRSSLLRAVRAAAQPFGCPAIGVRYSPAHLSKKLPPPSYLAGRPGASSAKLQLLLLSRNPRCIHSKGTETAAPGYSASAAGH